MSWTSNWYWDSLGVGVSCLCDATWETRFLKAVEEIQQDRQRGCSRVRSVARLQSRNMLLAVLQSRIYMISLRQYKIRVLQ